MFLMKLLLVVGFCLAIAAPSKKEIPASFGFDHTRLTKIAKGGFSRVYGYEGGRSRESYVVKVPKLRKGSFQASVNELKFLRRLENETRVVNLVDSFLSPRGQILMLERADGTLHEYVCDNPGMDREEKVELIYQMALGLEQIHKHSIW
jgi:serine/threonine protein kinase